MFMKFHTHIMSEQQLRMEDLYEGMTLRVKDASVLDGTVLDNNDKVTVGKCETGQFSVSLRTLQGHIKWCLSSQLCAFEKSTSA